MTTKTELLNNGVVVATKTAAPFYPWDWTPASGASSLTYKRYEDNVLVFTSGAITGTVEVVGDTTAPTVPTNLAVATKTDTTANLTWTASTDVLGVVSYNVYKDAVLFSNVPSNSGQVTGLTTETPYSFTVSALDAAGNESAQSTALSVNTNAASTQQAEVTTFYSTAGYTDSVMEDKLNTFVKGLKDALIWSKITTAYVMVGDTADKMFYNLKDATVGKMTGTPTNAVPFVITTDFALKGGYLNTNLQLPTTLNDYHMISYTEDNPANHSSSVFVPMGVGAYANGDAIQLLYNNNYIFRNTLDTGKTAPIGSHPYSSPRLMATSIDGIVVNGVDKNAVNKSSGNFNNTIHNPNSITVGKYRIATKNIGYAGFGTNLTVSELITYSNLVNDLKGFY